MNNMAFTPVEGLLNKISFPSSPASEDEARQQFQTPLNQLRDFVNNNIISFINTGGYIPFINTQAIRFNDNNIITVGATVHGTGGKATIIKNENGNAIEWGNCYNDTIVSLNSQGDGNAILGTPYLTWRDVYLKGVTLSTTGFNKLPNGMIIQWGRTNLSLYNTYGSATVTLPMVFPNSILTQSVNCSYNVTSSSSASIEDVACSVYVNSLSQMTIKAKPTSTFGSTTNFEFRWLAIGY